MAATFLLLMAYRNQTISKLSFLAKEPCKPFANTAKSQAFWLICYAHALFFFVSLLLVSSIQALLATCSHVFVHVGATCSNRTCILQRMAMLPQSVVEAVETVLKSKDGVVKKWWQIMETLLSAKLAYKQVFPPTLFMVHPLHRGGHRGQSVCLPQKRRRYCHCWRQVW